MTQSILLVDDSATIRASVSKTLVVAGYHVIQASDGEEAIELVKSHCPDLAIIDILMPGIDGYAVCDELKRMGEPWRSLPILFLTCVESTALELLGRQFGGYLKKPAQAKQLLEAIDQTLSVASRTTSQP